MYSHLYICSELLEIPLGEFSGYVDMTLDSGAEFHGVILFPQNAVIGDTVNLDAVHPQLGIVAEYSNGAHISPKCDEISILIDQKENPAIIASGISLRFSYNAVDTTGRKCIIWVRLRK